VQSCPTARVDRGVRDVVQVERCAVTRSQCADPQHAVHGLQRGGGILVPDDNERIRRNVDADRTAVGEESLLDFFENRYVCQSDQKLSGCVLRRVPHEPPPNVSLTKICRHATRRKARLDVLDKGNVKARAFRVAFSRDVHGAPLKGNCGSGANARKLCKCNEGENGVNKKPCHAA
jgi:hypothetical protein